MAADVLSLRALNRATLARQLLLERSPLAPLPAIERLVGLQAQNPLDPYLALWSRLEGFDPLAVGDLLGSRALVRIVAMRGTIHLLSAEDALTLRPLLQPVLDAELARHSQYAPALVDVDLAPVMTFAAPLLAATPLSGTKLRAALAERFPEHDAAALAYACRCCLPLVQVPPRGVWGRTLQVTSTTLEAWVGRRPARDASIDDVVLRYLAAFGPASVADVAAWTRLTGLREVVERLRPRLRPFTDPAGRSLVDLPDAARPDPDTPAPVRYLPEYDNVLLSHADRSRFAAPDGAGFDRAGGVAKGTVRVDGCVRAIWRVELDRSRGTATAVVEHHPLPKRTVARVEAEGRRAIRFWQPEATAREVRLLPIG
jgi:hypothetical protein